MGDLELFQSQIGSGDFEGAHITLTRIDKNLPDYSGPSHHLLEMAEGHA